MKSLNKKFNLPEIQKIMMEFEKESGMMDMKEEMMNDAIDDAMEDADDEEETEEIVNKVLEEIGINLDTQVRGLSSVYPFPKLTTHRYLSFLQMGVTPSTPVVKAKNEGAETDLDAQLQARLENLRRE